MPSEHQPLDPVFSDAQPPDDDIGSVTRIPPPIRDAPPGPQPVSFPEASEEDWFGESDVVF